MNRISLISLVAAAAALVLATAPAQAAPAGAGEGTPGYPHEVAAAHSTVSRADVRAEAARALAEGRIASGEAAVTAAAASPRTIPLERVQVRAEAAEAVRLGLIVSGEGSLAYTAPQLAQIKAAGERASRIVVAGQR
ncbi:MAG: DUF4148 domain-containing protein [Rubrivivax sp.]|nr:DUF4148 domain-containing protein [Rubrivivax sp.]